MPSCNAAIISAFEQQAGWCARLGSPFTATVLEILIEDIAAGGGAAALVAAWDGDPVADAVPLRLAGGLHALVLKGGAPDLAAHYPPNPAPDRAALAKALGETLRQHVHALRRFIASPPQTNEVARSAVLLGGFLRIAEETRLPLRLLEIGASAGLNLLWDHYAYDLGGARWGNPSSAVRLKPDWHGAAPPISAPLTIASRAGCDIAPIDVKDGGQALRLRAYVWADQRERLARIEAAIRMAQVSGYAVDAADAAEWLDRQLAAPVPGVATVVYHSIMWQYMPAASRARISDTLPSAGGAATVAAPLAWLRFEPEASDAIPDLRLTLWPGGDEYRLATAHPHGSSIRWLG
jgi:hypothetical protein